MGLLNTQIAIVVVAECFWSRNLFYERILQQLSVHPSDHHHSLASDDVELLSVHPKQARGYHNTRKCGSLDSFIEQLKELLPSALVPGSDGTDRPFIIIDNIDRLDRKIFGENILAALLRLEELVRQQNYTSRPPVRHVLQLSNPTIYVLSIRHNAKLALF